MPSDDPADLERLPRLHYAVAAALALATAVLMVPFAFGLRALASPEAYLDQQVGPLATGPSLSGALLLSLGALSLLYGVLVCAGLVLAAGHIRARRRFGFCVVVAVAVTFFFPLGTLLGFHTIDVLTGPTARRAFGGPPPPLA
jgi:hypothetical protein